MTSLFLNDTLIGTRKGQEFTFKKTNQIDELLNYQPEIALIFSVELDFNIYSLWKSYIEKSKFKFCIICYSFKEYYAKYNSTHLQTVCPIYAEETGFKIDALGYINSLKILLYPANYSRNWIYFYNLPQIEHTNKNIKHIHIGHGDSDKPSSYIRAQKIYDYILLADQTAINRYKNNNINLPDSIYLKMGAPIAPGMESIDHPSSLKNILYIPTFEGNNAQSNYSSLKTLHTKLVKYFKEDTQNHTLSFRPHPATGSRISEYADYVEELKKVASFYELPKSEIFNKSDAAICDISGITSEYLFTGKPIIIPICDETTMRTLKASTLSKVAYLWSVNSIPLDTFLKSIAQDPLFSIRKKYRDEKFLHAINFDESAANFDKALEHAIIQPPLPLE